MQDAARVHGITLIPRPAGLRYTTADVRGKTGISSKEWNAIQFDVRALARVADLDIRVDFRLHDKQKLAWIRREAVARHPVLRDYENQWPAMIMVGSYLLGMRTIARKEGTLPPGPWKRGGGLPRKTILRPHTKILGGTLASIRSAAGLGPATFDRIRVDINTLVDALLDPCIPWTKQGKDKIRSFRQQIAEKHPVLEKYPESYRARADRIRKETDTPIRTLDF
ncbi:uncharacterized protein BXZ73DRAFT_98282 [Epithele typhae]|uniref:uncharacterized protein n=1 Tax=Epithele typhae TaxID=378194 RepID=UPI00200725AE|nr:uncharacterized protein BXZ73DRAFT_98282 [Epithele typhae]KAH9941894.1 hypothetical protein BXZ73DRAFT_98282 [Epithele typhae]